MSLLSSVLGVLFVSVAVVGSPLPKGTIATEQNLSWQAEVDEFRLIVECDQEPLKTGPVFNIPRLEFHKKPLMDQSGPTIERPTGFCAALSGPVDGGARCDFRLLA